MSTAQGAGPQPSEFEHILLTSSGVVDHAEVMRDAIRLVGQICGNRSDPKQMREALQSADREYGEAFGMVAGYTTLLLGSAVIGPLVDRLTELGDAESDVIDLVTSRLQEMTATKSRDE